MKTKLQLIENKHSKTSILPSKGDIKDGLLKMILYTNIYTATINGRSIKTETILSLTSNKLKGKITTSSTSLEITDFCKINHLTQSQQSLIHTVIKESKVNKFTIIISYAQ